MDDDFTYVPTWQGFVSLRGFRGPSGATVHFAVGDSYDTALAETIIGLFKAEVINRLGPWKTVGAVEWERLNWVDWFNNRRLLEPIGHIPPAEAKKNFANVDFDTVAPDQRKSLR